MSINPIGDHTQLCSFRPSIFLYFPSSTRVSHSTREKFTFQTSPSRGGPGLSVCTLNAAHGIAISTSHPLSLSLGSLIVPCTLTAVFSPSMLNELSPFPPSRYGFRKSRSHTVFSALTSNS